MYYVIIINYGIVLLYTIRANGTVVAGALSARGVGAMMTSNFAPSLSSRGQPRSPFSLSVLELAARAMRMIMKVSTVHTVTIRGVPSGAASERAASNTLRSNHCNTM